MGSVGIFEVYIRSRENTPKVGIEMEKKSRHYFHIDYRNSSYTQFR